MKEYLENRIKELEEDYNRVNDIIYHPYITYDKTKLFEGRQYIWLAIRELRKALSYYNELNK